MPHLLQPLPPRAVRLLIYRDVNLQLSLLDPTQIYNMFEVELVKKPGRVGRKNEPGVYVSEVVKGGAAEADNRLMTGDQILAVNGQDVANSMQEDVAAMLKTCVGRVGRWKITETANRVHAAAEALARSQTTPRTDESRPSVSSERKDVPPPAPPLRPIITHTSPEGEAVAEADVHLSPVTEEPSSGTDQRSLQDEERGVAQGMELLSDLKEEGSDTLLLELKKVRLLIYRDVNLQLSLLDPTQIYNMFEVELVKKPGRGLGLSIVGRKNEPGVYVSEVVKGGAAEADNRLMTGDQILAVNGQDVANSMQEDVAAMLKTCVGRVCLKVVNFC
ncbi:PDZ/DHR/GLGF domain protein [Teladorsagia circumcincta]|uniref:PDZ/DHR/GLGF domain protein n=1 Tax=Teladorsagia circumcincta TaxID=45464 RepID=A0A2G9V2U6_TELCI|nr:PDZ/DHR/GLGF domain protein [Teladorsagia circumcincta]